VLRDSRAADGEPARKLSDRRRASAEAFDDRPTCRVAQRIDGRVVSYHLR